LELGITWLVKQVLSKQAVSSITGLISIESNSESEACEVEVLKSLRIKSGLLEISVWIQSMVFKLLLENFFKISSDSYNLFSSASTVSKSMVFSDFKESIKNVIKIIVKSKTLFLA